MTQLTLARPPSGASESLPELLLGHTEPRLFTPPLRGLKPDVFDEDGNLLEPATTYGYRVIDFARDVLGLPLDPWEERAVIRGGELLEDGITPRFRYVLLIVARQNGKTILLRVLKLYWLFVEQWPFTLGMANGLTQSRRDWKKLCQMAKQNPVLRKQLPQRKNMGVNTQIGQEAIETADGCEYVIAAPNSNAGRSDSIDRLAIDELRVHRDFEAWEASTNAMQAREYAQAFCITNMGDDKGIVLDWLRDAAIIAIESGDTDTDIGLLEYSPPKGADPMDPQTWAYANPNMNRPGRIAERTLRGKAKAASTDPVAMAKFKTEALCIRVRLMEPAIDPLAWARGYLAGDLRDVKPQAWCIDSAKNGRHVSLVAAGKLADDRVRVQPLREWTGPNALDEASRDLPALVAKHKPHVLGWFPNGPAAALDVTIKDRRKQGRYEWPPPGVNVEGIRQDTSAVCMGFAQRVQAGSVVHGNDQMLNDQVEGTEKVDTGDTWRFDRKGGDCDATYAAAGAEHLARTMPAPVGPVRVRGLA